ncbi:MAG: 2-polyprenyl-6-methoxyphenol hydroxylase [Proteobacteria bacterium]|nr:MAG: 2-polyprenyl-6-methoxyphenol hydroxylase [Pseudomonadota bacterium]
MGNKHRVLIVGGGIGGLCLAIGLGRVGIRADVIEITKAWTALGVGIIQPGNAVRAYKALGIADRCFERGFAYHRLRYYDADGSLLGERVTPPIDGLDVGNCGIPRPVLQEILVSEAVSLGARIRLGVTVSELTQRGEAVDVVTTDGSAQTYDLVVGADGTYSKLRAMVFGDAYQPRFSGQGCWRFTTAKPPEMDYAAIFHGPNKAGLIPLTRTSMYIFITTREPGNPWMPEDRLHDLMRERLEGHTGFVAEIRDRIRRPQDVVYKPLETILVPPPWHRGRVLIVGDAAHSTTPHHAQGAAMAVEDAVILSQLLAREDDVPAVLEQFTARRWDRCRLVVEASNQVCEWELHPTPTSVSDSMNLGNYVRDRLALAF